VTVKLFAERIPRGLLGKVQKTFLLLPLKKQIQIRFFGGEVKDRCLSFLMQLKDIEIKLN